jgi:hypothetical protein
MSHAAAAARDGGGIMVIGDRDSGKTTALLTLLGTGAYDFVTADRLSLRQDGRGLVVMEGVPARANVHDVSFGPGERLDGLVDGADWDAAVEGKVLVDVHALCGHFGTGVVPRAVPVTVLLPQVGSDIAIPSAEVIGDESRSRALIRGHLLEGDVPGNTHRPWLETVLSNGAREPGSLDALLSRLVGQCRVVAFRGTYAAYIDWLETAMEEHA